MDVYNTSVTITIANTYLTGFIIAHVTPTASTSQVSKHAFFSKDFRGSPPSSTVTLSSLLLSVGGSDKAIGDEVSVLGVSCTFEYLSSDINQ